MIVNIGTYDSCMLKEILRQNFTLIERQLTEFVKLAFITMITNICDIKKQYNVGFARWIYVTNLNFMALTTLALFTTILECHSVTPGSLFTY